MQLSSPRGVPRGARVAGAPLRGPIFQRPVIMGSRLRGNDRTRDHIPEASRTLRPPLQAAAVRVAFPAECWRRRMVQGTAGSAVPAVALSQGAISFRPAHGGSYAAGDRTSLAVADREFVALVGPTGCGQSTLLHVPPRP